MSSIAVVPERLTLGWGRALKSVATPQLVNALALAMLDIVTEPVVPDTMFLGEVDEDVRFQK